MVTHLSESGVRKILVRWRSWPLPTDKSWSNCRGSRHPETPFPLDRWEWGLLSETEEEFPWSRLNVGRSKVKRRVNEVEYLPG